MSSLGQVVVSGAILCLQISFIKQISTLIREANLDLTPVRSTFCRNLSVVGFIFLVQCGDVGIDFFAHVFNHKSKSEQETENSTPFVILGISV